MVEISIVITEEQMDELEALFCEELQQNWLLFQKDSKSAPWLKGYFDSESEAIDALKALQQELEGLSSESFQIQPVQEQDWKMAYRHHLKHWQYGRLNWVPEWERESFSKKEGHAYLYLDSGMAFGTGSHETTRLCVEALYDYLEKLGEAASRQRIIDAGCGSGILAMSAAVLGLTEIYAFDRDSEAVKVTVQNLKDNDLSEVIEVVEAGLERGFDNRQGDVILANIQADVLMIYSDRIVDAWNPEGILILSGILAPEREAVITEFKHRIESSHPGVDFNYRWDQKGDWVSVIFERKN